MQSEANIPTSPARAGRYVSQATGLTSYRAFIPERLPPRPPIQITPEMQALLSQADRALGRLDGSIQTLPHPDLSVLMYVHKEAVLSSQIESAQRPLQDEVANYVRALYHGLHRLPALPVSVRLIRELHAKLLEGVRGPHRAPGELRTSQNWIGPAGCTLKQATFVPPPPHELDRLLSELDQFLHDDAQLPLLIKIGLAHARFETIHPFLDGNGRVGRLLITLLLCEQRVLVSPVLYLSYYFKRHRQQYYDHLQAVRDTGDWEGWLKFFLNGVVEVSMQATQIVRRILGLREEHRRAISRQLGRAAGSAHRVLEHLYAHPIVSVGDVQALIGTTYPAANALVARMVDMGILQEITGQARNRKFRYEPYVQLFSEGDAAAGQ